LAHKRSVLIVDSSRENQEVLQTALEHRGLRTLTADRVGSGLELARRLEPDLIVLDLETDGKAGEEVSAPFLRQTRPRHTPVVMLGTVRRQAAAPGGEFVAKPYHYGPLIRKIEELLGARTASCDRAT